MLRRNVDIPRQPCNKLIWAVVLSSTVAICFATCDGSQSHTKCKGILGRDCSPPSPVPAHKLASKQAYLSIWFSTLLSFGPHLWFCLSQWCHVLRDCGTILQGASKHITTTLWRVIRHQHDLDSHFARTSECQASLYIIKCYSMCSCKLACSIIYIYIYKFTQITNTRKTPVIAVLEQIAAPGGYRAPQSDMLLNDWDWEAFWCTRVLLQ